VPQVSYHNQPQAHSAKVSLAKLKAESTSRGLQHHSLTHYPSTITRSGVPDQFTKSYLTIDLQDGLSSLHSIRIVLFCAPVLSPPPPHIPSAIISRTPRKTKPSPHATSRQGCPSPGFPSYLEAHNAVPTRFALCLVGRSHNGASIRRCQPADATGILGL
jgi:hypothetical protein